MKRVFIAVLMIVLLGACAPLVRPTDPPPLPTVVDTAIPTHTSAPTITPAPTQVFSDGAFLAKPEGATLRVLSYNINWDSIFPDDDRQNHSFRTVNRVDSFVRILNAVQPDVICLNEINPSRKSADLAALLDTALASDAWSAVIKRDNVIASQFGLTVDGYALDISSYPPEMPQAAALVDLPDDPFGADLWVVCAHFKSAGAAADIALRQRQADAIISEVGDALTIGDAIDLASNTPFVLMGDFNIYDTDPAAHYDTLVNGDIFDEDRYGPDILPDWDGSALGDALPSINQEGKLFYTWREDRSSFAPGPLDRILYTDSLLAIVNSFVLDTTKLSEAALAQFGLEKDDVLMNATPGFYDHLPIVVDFALIEE